MPGLKLARVASHGHQLADRLVIGTHVATRVLEHRPGRLQKRLDLREIVVVPRSRNVRQLLPAFFGNRSQLLLGGLGSTFGQLFAFPVRHVYQKTVGNSLEFPLLHSGEDGLRLIIRDNLQRRGRQFGQQFRANAQITDLLGLCDELLHGAELK